MTQVRTAAAAAAAVEIRSAGAHREPLLSTHHRQHADGEATLRHVQKLDMSSDTVDGWNSTSTEDVLADRTSSSHSNNDVMKA